MSLIQLFTILSLYLVSDDGSDSSESDGPPLHMMDKIGKKASNSVQLVLHVHIVMLIFKSTHNVHVYIPTAF